MATTKRCPNCGKLLYVNYDLSKMGKMVRDCRKDNGGCGYRNTSLI